MYEKRVEKTSKFVQKEQIFLHNIRNVYDRALLEVTNKYNIIVTELDTSRCPSI